MWHAIVQDMPAPMLPTHASRVKGCGMPQAAPKAAADQPAPKLLACLESCASRPVFVWARGRCSSLKGAGVAANEG